MDATGICQSEMCLIEGIYLLVIRDMYKWVPSV